MERPIPKFRTHPNLVDHLEAFVTVYETGGFTAASRKLGRAVSSISYSVSQLEAMCGFALLTREVGRVDLTEKGKAVFSEALTVVDSARRFSAHARLLESGEETRLRVLVDVLFPRRQLIAALTDFSSQHPRTQIQLFNASLNTLWHELRTETYDMAFTVASHIPPDFEARTLGSARLAPYCSVDHRLAHLPEPIRAAEFQKERQIYFVGSPEIDIERVGRVFSTDIWTVDDVEQIRQLAIQGMGWCFGADYTFEQEVARGRMKRLVCEDAKLSLTRIICLASPLQRPPGVIGSSLVECIVSQF